MEFSEIINMVLPVVYVVVGIALVWVLVEVVMTLRKARGTVDAIQKQVEPTRANVERITTELEPVVANVRQITDQIQPAVGKVDPLVERVSLTVDAVNLEMMRVDQILEDVTHITDSVSKTLDTVDTVTSAPVELVNSVSDKVRARFAPKTASRESVNLGQAKAAEGEKPNPVKNFVNAVAEAVEAKTSGAKVVPVQDASKAASAQAVSQDVAKDVPASAE